MQQKNKRILRSIAPQQYVLYVENTQDSVYVITALENFNSEYVATIDLEDI